jgi:hypothetical protein
MIGRKGRGPFGKFKVQSPKFKGSSKLQAGSSKGSAVLRFVRFWNLRFCLPLSFEL